MIEVKNPSALEMFLNHYLNGLEINSPLTFTLLFLQIYVFHT